MQANGKPTVLTIDDEYIFRQMIEISLVYQGLHVLPAESGMAGLALARSAMPDLILLDLVMPELDGVEVCKRLKADSALKNIPVVVLSGSKDSAEIEACIQMGAVDYLLKPFEPKLLAEVVLRNLPGAKGSKPAR